MSWTRNGQLSLGDSSKTSPSFFPCWRPLFADLVLEKYLYRWMDLPPGHDPDLDAKHGYLNWQFFLFRTSSFLSH